MTTYALNAVDSLAAIGVGCEKALKNNGFRGVRLTRRGRMISRLAVVVSLLVLIASGYSALAGVASDQSQGREHLEVIVVAPGENLWSIAKLLGGNQEENVARIIELNALATPQLSVGTRLIIPTRE
jgi:hypothetical protein